MDTLLIPREILGDNQKIGLLPGLNYDFFSN